MTKTNDPGALAGHDTEAETVRRETVPVSEKNQNTIERAGPTNGEEEIGGPPGPEPTRFGDWEKKGRCIDF